MLNICYYSSDFYSQYTGISILSLCENNKELDFRIHYIDAGVSKENKLKTIEIIKKYKREIIFYEFSAFEAHIRINLNLPPCNDSYATYIKIFPELLLNDIDTVLFIDGDTIIRNSIAEINNIDIMNYLFAAVKMPLVTDESLYTNADPNHPQLLRYQYSLKFRQSGYYNIGVLYMNLNKWKEFDVGKHILETRNNHPELLSDPDIPVDEIFFNLTILETIGIQYSYSLHPKYNLAWHFLPYKESLHLNNLCGYIDLKQFNEAYYDATVVHYIMYKPWNHDMYSRYLSDLIKYIKRSPWEKLHRKNCYTKAIAAIHGYKRKFSKFLHRLHHIKRRTFNLMRRIVRLTFGVMHRLKKFIRCKKAER